MKLTENFSLEEFERSETATKYGIDNKIPENLMENVKELANLLQIIRDAFGKPIRINSSYRTPALNKLVGGSKTSLHLVSQAADIVAVPNSRQSNRELFALIQKLRQENKISYGQLIDERNYQWIHISTGQKNQVLHL